MNLIGRVEAEFKKLFNEQPLLVRSPGRVNLIGEHTDYNHGLVLPAAVDRAMYFAVAPSGDRRCSLVALDMNDEHRFTIDSPQFSDKGWPNYLLGVVDQFTKASYQLDGFNCVFGGDIPIGAGLSSSAAIEAGLAYALNSLFELSIDDLALVKLAQRAENDFVGVRCGIMDQFVNIFGQDGRALCIDCRSLEFEYYPFGNDVAIVLFDTGLTRSLALSAYNHRREECNDGVAVIKKRYPSVTHLRDVSLEMLAEFKDVMDPTTYRRCHYVVEENNRVLMACQALKERDLRRFGCLMFRTHAGLRNEYEVSCDELDFLVESVKDDPQVYGARLMGGGFGGCTINLIEKDAVTRIASLVKEKYMGQFGVEPILYVTSIGPGTSIFNGYECVRD